MKIFRDDHYIILEEKEISIARLVAKKRVAENLARKTSDNEERLHQAHWPGALSELSVALFYNKEWEGVYYEGKEWENRGNDVKGIEVKSSFKWNNMCLSLEDPNLFPETPFIFVKLFKLPNSGYIGAKFRGWIYGIEAPKKGNLRRNRNTGKSFWLINKSHFRDMSTFPIQT